MNDPALGNRHNRRAAQAAARTGSSVKDFNDPALQAPAGPATPLAASGGNRHDRRAAKAAARTGSSVKDFAARNNLGLTKVYAEIGAGRLVAHKVGSRTIIFDDDELAWRASLPKLNPVQAGA
jgi:hypothetical protein